LTAEGTGSFSANVDDEIEAVFEKGVQQW